MLLKLLYLAAHHVSTFLCGLISKHKLNEWRSLVPGDEDDDDDDDTEVLKKVLLHSLNQPADCLTHPSPTGVNTLCYINT